MKKLLSVLCFTVFAGISGNVFADWYKAAAEPNLVVRDSPDVSGNKLGNVPYGGKVNVIERVGGKESIGGRSGYWVKIQWKNGDGYAFDAFLESLEGTASSKSDAGRVVSSDEQNIEERLINALRLKDGTNERVGDSGKAIQAYVREGILNKKPDKRSDYTDYYVVKKPTIFMKHELIVIEEEYMSEYIGCCVSPGAGVTVKIIGNTNNLLEFAQENGCSVKENVNLKQELADLGINRNLPTGEFASLTCRERDVDQ